MRIIINFLFIHILLLGTAPEVLSVDDEISSSSRELFGRTRDVDYDAPQSGRVPQDYADSIRNRGRTNAKDIDRNDYSDRNRLGPPSVSRGQTREGIGDKSSKYYTASQPVIYQAQMTPRYYQTTSSIRPGFETSTIGKGGYSYNIHSTNAASTVVSSNAVYGTVGISRYPPTSLKFQLTGGLISQSINMLNSQTFLLIRDFGLPIQFPVRITVFSSNGIYYINNMMANMNDIITITTGSNVPLAQSLTIQIIDNQFQVQEFTMDSSGLGNLSLGNTFGALSLVEFTNGGQGTVYLSNGAVVSSGMVYSPPMNPNPITNVYQPYQLSQSVSYPGLVNIVGERTYQNVVGGSAGYPIYQGNAGIVNSVTTGRTKNKKDVKFQGTVVTGGNVVVPGIPVYQGVYGRPNTVTTVVGGTTVYPGNTLVTVPGAKAGKGNKGVAAVPVPGTQGAVGIPGYPNQIVVAGKNGKGVVQLVPGGQQVVVGAGKAGKGPKGDPGTILVGGAGGGRVPVGGVIGVGVPGGRGKRGNNAVVQVNTSVVQGPAVPLPPVPEMAPVGTQCTGRPTELTFQLTPGTCAASIPMNNQGPLFNPTVDVLPTDMTSFLVRITGSDGSSLLNGVYSRLSIFKIKNDYIGIPDQVTVQVWNPDGAAMYQEFVFSTSLRIGDKFCSLTVGGCNTPLVGNLIGPVDKGENVVNPNPQCKEEPKYLEFEFTGDSCAVSQNSQGSHFFCTLDKTPITFPANVKITSADMTITYYNGQIASKGVTFSIGDGVNPIGATEMTVTVTKANDTEPQQVFTFATSCFVDLYVNNSFGSLILKKFILTPIVSFNPPPTVPPTMSPTPLPTNAPTPLPTMAPTPLTSLQNKAPTSLPTETPTIAPTNAPTPLPTAAPTPLPTNAPTPLPTNAPTPLPTRTPTASPTSTPSSHPSESPSSNPSIAPSPCRETQCIQHACIYEFMLYDRKCSDLKWNDQTVQYYQCLADGQVTFPAYVKISTQDLSAVLFEGVVNKGDTIIAQNSGVCTEGISAKIFNQDESELIQFFRFNADCTSSPMWIGDFYGALRVTSFTNPIQGRVEGCMLDPP